jgi:hypothetical protein
MKSILRDLEAIDYCIAGAAILQTCNTIASVMLLERKRLFAQVGLCKFIYKWKPHFFSHISKSNLLMAWV